MSRIITRTLLAFIALSVGMTACGGEDETESDRTSESFAAITETGQGFTLARLGDGQSTIRFKSSHLSGKRGKIEVRDPGISKEQLAGATLILRLTESEYYGAEQSVAKELLGNCYDDTQTTPSTLACGIYDYDYRGVSWSRDYSKGNRSWSLLLLNNTEMTIDVDSWTITFDAAPDFASEYRTSKNPIDHPGKGGIEVLGAGFDVPLNSSAIRSLGLKNIVFSFINGMLGGTKGGTIILEMVGQAHQKLSLDQFYRLELRLFEAQRDMTEGGGWLEMTVPRTMVLLREICTVEDWVPSSAEAAAWDYIVKAEAPVQKISCSLPDAAFRPKTKKELFWEITLANRTGEKLAFQGWKASFLYEKGSASTGR